MSAKVYGVGVETMVSPLGGTENEIRPTITIIGSKGKIICDANELKVHFKTSECPAGYTKGWNVKYITDLQEPVDFYLRGEEYAGFKREFPLGQSFYETSQPLIENPPETIKAEVIEEVHGQAA